ncbi:MAG: glycosyltransferase family 39 protein [Lentimicrobiaceae bacterium]|nr:glycosyltransferase family 39 protein [Lentimicrobiaceae bacterium]MCB9022959.1 glycosyltransferase family 39 protein [Lentimicrobiaceae bacterium]MCO5266128.1 glycosyltransferase family 39 protein [Lentimicrobium sp.]
MLFPALLWHLGFLAINFPTDEPTRAIVALEMIVSGNYITPTINGEFYFNKPPLYNWIIVLFYKLAGNYSEFTLRLPMVISLLLFGLTIFQFVRRHLGNMQGFVVAMLFITSGRILFWDSFLGLIDITFSWLVYSAFMLIYYFHSRKQYLALFLVSYLLTALTFMMKGLPSLVFQGITLLVFFSYNREFKKLFSWRHFAGIGLFILIVGSYYLAYFRYNSLDNVFVTLFSESEKRTIINYGWKRFVSHLFTFPLEMFYHFFPWSVLWIFFFKKDFRKTLHDHPFLRFNFLVFIYNIIIYWTSPESYPRYIFMLFPPLFTILVYMFFLDRAAKGRWSKVVEGFLLAVLILGTMAAIPMPILKQTGFVNFAWLKASVMFAVMAMLTWIYLKVKEQRMIIFAAAMLMLRIGFDWFIIPPRYDDFQVHKDGALKAAAITGSAKLHIYKNSETEHATSFYITLGKMQLLQRQYDDFNTTDYYYLDPRLLPQDAYETIYDFQLYRHDRPIKIARLNEKGVKYIGPEIEINP